MGPSFPADPVERAALGIPGSFPAPEGGRILRLDGLSRHTARCLAAVLVEGGASTRFSGGRGPGAIVAGIPGDRWSTCLRRLAAATAPLPEIAREIGTTLRAGRRRFRSLRLARRRIPLGSRTLIQGILNVTPDSFYDGGRWADPGRAVDRAFRMAEEGAGLVDIGGESTRPGSRAVTAREETRRILPVLASLAGRLPVPVSVDTTKSEVAAAALDAGAEIINDVSGLTFDPRLARVVARHRAGLILSHLRGRPRTMQENPRYRHLFPEVLAFLRRAADRALDSGVEPGSILIDPGIGFGKTVEHNLLLLKHLRVLRGAGYPVLVGASRKSFLGKILGGGSEERLEGSLAAAALAVYNGASALRVHDVAATAAVVRVAEAVRDVAMAKTKE